VAEEKNIEVPASDDGQRLDRWLKRYMPYGLVQKLVRKGAIRVDGVKAKKDMRIAAGADRPYSAYRR
jgi:23S rRNA pseudouridine955/2504/2580 synthase